MSDWQTVELIETGWVYAEAERVAKAAASSQSQGESRLQYGDEYVGDIKAEDKVIEKVLNESGGRFE